MARTMLQTATKVFVQAMTKSRPENPAPTGAMRRILLADGGHDLSTWVDVAARAVGAAVTRVRSGDELESALLDDGPFDLVVTHVRLEGQSGLQALARTRSLNISAPFIVVMSVHGRLVRIMVSDDSTETLSSRMVDDQNLAALARSLVRSTSIPPVSGTR